MKYITNNELIKYGIYCISILITFLLLYYLEHLLSRFIPNDLILRLIELVLTLMISHYGIFKCCSKCFFKIPLLKNTIINFNGEWEGTGTSSHDNKTFEVTIEIVQTLTTISINAYFPNAYFPKSKSEASFSCCVIKESDKEKLIYNYSNNPNNTEQSLYKHYGTMVLEKLKDNKLEGNYFTDRKTKGTINVTIKNN